MDGGTSSDGFVLFFDGGGTTFCDPGGEEGLEGEGDEVVVVEEVGEEGVDFGDLGEEMEEG